MQGTEQEREQRQYERMTATPIPRLVVTLGIPTTISMLITNLYNMADTYFVSTLGNSASGATGVVYALMAIIQAFGFMIGQGAGSIVSRSLGAHDTEKARRITTTGFAGALFCGLGILILGFLFQTPLMRLLGSTDSILPYAKTYSTYILIAAPAMAGSCVLNNILRYEGKAVFSMIGLISGGILNIFGDYLLMRVLDYGIAGAGISTAVSQYLSILILAVPFLRGQVQTRLQLRYLILRPSEIGNVLGTGFPSMLRQGLGSISVMVLNLCAKPYGDAAIAAFSIVSRVANFLFCVGLGMFQGFQPVSAFNFGARRYSRVREAALFTTGQVSGIMTVTCAVGFFFAEPILHAFRDDPQVIQIGVKALRFQAVSMLTVPVSLCGNMLFQSTGRKFGAIFLSSLRGGLLYIPTMLLLSKMLGLLGIQLTQAVADVLAAAVTVPMLVSYLRHLPEDGKLPVEKTGRK